MLTSQDCVAALSVERKMYLALSEFLDLTGELSDAVERQDQVSVQLFLNMRQEQVNLLRDCKTLLRKQCRSLPGDAGKALRAILSGEGSEAAVSAELCRQVEKNRQLLERAVAADRRLSRRMGGDKSFYGK